VARILAYRREHPKGRLLVVLPPGGGKTVIAVAVMKTVLESGGRGLIAAHRREIIMQHYNQMLASGLEWSQLGVIMAGDPRYAIRAPIQVASIQTLSRRKLLPPIDILVTDEAHRDPSYTRRKLRASYPDAFKLGFTATPHRLGRRDGLLEDFDDLLVVSSVGELIADGYLAAPRVFTVPDDLLPKLHKTKLRAGDFADLDPVMNQRSLVGGIVDHWKRLGRNLRTVCFAASIKHSKRIVERFQSSGVAAAHLDQTVTPHQRSETLASLVEGDLRLVSCVDILSEGWDCPAVKCVIQARPTKSLNLYIQQTGRAMRPWQGEIPLILDHAGNTLIHGLPQMDREWTLEGGSSHIPGDAPVKVCGVCYAVLHAALNTCAECGFEFPSRQRVLKEEEGDLREHTLSKEEHSKELERIRAFAANKGFDEQWVQRVFQAKFNQIDHKLSEIGVGIDDANPFL